MNVPPIRVLVLGGTFEARQLAVELAADDGIRVISSLAGRTADPEPIEGEVRVGGFGGVDGLVSWLRAKYIHAVVDATHPFARTITNSAVQATAMAGVPLLMLIRPEWQPGPGDDWRFVPSTAAAADLLPSLGERVLLTIGRQQVGAFAGLAELWFLIRSVDPLRQPLPANHLVILDRGPFTVEGETALMREHRIDVVVSKNSGSGHVAAKLAAARELGLPVVLIQRPAPPPDIPAVSSLSQAISWVRSLSTSAKYCHDS